jgi:hypothetical protein
MGVSTGVKGMRLGSGPRGTYVHMGRGGLYYRQTLASPGGRRRTPATAPRQRATFLPSPELVQDDLPSVTVLDMAEAAPTDLVNELNTAANRFVLSPIAWLKGQRRVPVIYDVNDGAARAFDALVEAFHDVQRSQGRWLVDTQGAVSSTYQQKVNAGATSLLTRQPAGTSLDGPKWLSTNIAVPGLTTRRFSVHLLPDQVLLRTGKRFAAWRYSDLAVRLATTRFIEEQAVPGDAQKVGETWKYVNKSGGPDRRFNNNRVLPIMSYAELEVTGIGLRLLWQISNVAAASEFARGLTSIPTLDPVKAVDAPASAPPRQPAAAVPMAPAAATLPAPPSPPPAIPATAPADWYPDPFGEARLRWWDGSGWTSHTG